MRWELTIWPGQNDNYTVLLKQEGEPMALETKIGAEHALAYLTFVEWLNRNEIECEVEDISHLYNRCIHEVLGEADKNE